MVDFGLWLTYFRNFKSNGYGYKEIDGGGIHTCGLGDNGQAYCWGANGFGELGNGGNTSSNTPVEVKQGEYLLHGDLNDDNRISMEDFRIWLDIYRKCKDQP